MLITDHVDGNLDQVNFQNIFDHNCLSTQLVHFAIVLLLVMSLS